MDLKTRTLGHELGPMKNKCPEKLSKTSENLSDLSGKYLSGTFLSCREDEFDVGEKLFLPIHLIPLCHVLMPSSS
jgi:hypothetical protein